MLSMTHTMAILLPSFVLSLLCVFKFLLPSRQRTVHNNGFPFPLPLLFFCLSPELQKHHLHPSSNSDPRKSEASQSMPVAEYYSAERSFFSKTIFINLGNELRCTFSSVTRQRSQKPVCLSYTGNPTPVAPSFFSSDTTLAFPFSFQKINCAPFLPNERRETWLIMTAT